MSNRDNLIAHLDRDIMVLRQSNGRSYLPEPVKEHRFAPGRKYAFDRCWIDSRIAIEVEGGIWMQTSTGRSKGHAHPKRFEDDCEKYNLACLLGWRVFRFTGAMIEDGRAYETLESVFPPF
jgi:hypothetical protein